MSPIKDFNLVYEALNEGETFSEGDTIAGAVTFSLTKDTKVKYLTVKAKGDASVRWSKGSGDNRRTYSAKRRYFKLKAILVAEDANGTVLSQGIHHFKFEFQIPQGDMPSSFKGVDGNIVYMLEAKLSRSWRMSSLQQKEFKFVYKSHPSPQVMCEPQSGSVDKELGVFSKKQVQMTATINTCVCSPGDTLSVVAKINNSSSKKVRPKFSFQQLTVYSASGSTKTVDQSLCKMIGNPISLTSEQTVSCQMKIPADANFTIHNCDILSVDYYVKVYLDISFAYDPEVMFPLVVVPPGFAPLHPGEAVGPYPAGTIGAPSYSDFPPPAFPVGPNPVPAASGAYACPALDHTQHADTPSAFRNQWPQQADPTTDMSSVPPQAPTAPPFQEIQELPSYTALFSSPQPPLNSR